MWNSMATTHTKQSVLLVHVMLYYIMILILLSGAIFQPNEKTHVLRQSKLRKRPRQSALTKSVGSI